MKNDETTTTPEKIQVIPFPGNLRDWFAGQAMVAIYGNLKGTEKESTIISLPKTCYAIADALLAARATKEKA